MPDRQPWDEAPSPSYWTWTDDLPETARYEVLDPAETCAAGEEHRTVEVFGAASMIPDRALCTNCGRYGFVAVLPFGKPPDA